MHSPYAGFAPAERVIFAVDDEAEDRRLFGQLLQQAGIAAPCRFFTSGDEMMDALLGVLRGAPAPLACFIDVHMAGMSGFDVLRWIRCQGALDEVPVIMLSSSEDPKKLREAQGVGAQCYLAKFPSPADLRATIAEAQRFAEERSAGSAFHLDCNLLLNPVPAPRTSTTAFA